MDKLKQFYNKRIVNPLVQRVINRNAQKREKYFDLEIQKFNQEYKDETLRNKFHSDLSVEKARVGKIVDRSIAEGQTRAYLKNIAGSLAVAAVAGAVTGVVFAPAAPLVFAGMAVNAIGTFAYKYSTISNPYNGRVKGAFESVRDKFDYELNLKHEKELAEKQKNESSTVTKALSEGEKLEKAATVTLKQGVQNISPYKSSKTVSKTVLNEIIDSLKSSDDVSKAWQEKVSQLQSRGTLQEYSMLDYKTSETGREIIWVSPAASAEKKEEYSNLDEAGKAGWLKQNQDLWVKYTYEGDKLKVTAGAGVQNTIVPPLQKENGGLSSVRAIGFDEPGEIKKIKLTKKSFVEIVTDSNQRSSGYRRSLMKSTYTLPAGGSVNYGLSMGRYL